MDDSDLRRLLEALEAEGVRYALFGATALNLLGLPHATQDVDILTRLGEAFRFEDRGDAERLRERFDLEDT